MSPKGGWPSTPNWITLGGVGWVLLLASCKILKLLHSLLLVLSAPITVLSALHLNPTPAFSPPGLSSCPLDPPAPQHLQLGPPSIHLHPPVSLLPALPPSAGGCDNISPGGLACSLPGRGRPEAARRPWKRPGSGPAWGRGWQRAAPPAAWLQGPARAVRQ